LLGAIGAVALVQVKEIAEKIERFARVEIAVKVGFFGEIADAGFGRDVAR